MDTMNTKTHAELWADQVVDMPGMGPGANKAGWWVSYLNELMMLGKYEEVLKYLSLLPHSRRRWWVPQPPLSKLSHHETSQNHTFTHMER